MSIPRYNHFVQNRTDLGSGGGSSGIINYSKAVSPYVDPYPPAGYAGEVIPPYACVRICAQATLYKDQICWPVCRPDDNSLQFQEKGLHFFNGPTPIPYLGYGFATQDLPAPVLIDMSALSDPYSGARVPSIAELIGLFFGYMSGTWALHAADDIIAAGISAFNTFSTFFPYSMLSKDLKADSNTPGGYIYSDAVYWMGDGGKGYQSVANEWL